MERRIAAAHSIHSIQTFCFVMETDDAALFNLNLSVHVAVFQENW